jgi:AraC family transcriptional regulator
MPDAHSTTRAPRGRRPLQLPAFDVLPGTHAPSSVLPRHTHDTATICCIERGRFTEFYQGKAVSCDTRMVKITPAGDPHWNRFDATETRGFRIDVDRSRFDDVPAVHQLLDERIFFRAATVTMWSRRLARELDARDGAAPIAVEGLVLELLAHLARIAAPAASAPPSWLLRADQIVHDEFTAPLTLSAIAAQVGVHPATLARAYRRTFGCTIGERIRELRIEFAARRLAATSDPLSEIALAAGFYDQSHFTNAFRRQLAVTPAQFRQRARS